MYLLVSSLMRCKPNPEMTLATAEYLPGKTGPSTEPWAHQPKFTTVAMHQMSDFMDKMHQIRFRLELCPRTRCGSLQRSPDSLAGFKEEEEEEMEMREE